MSTLGVEALSPREAEVLEALGEHLTNAEIARQLHISVRTVESHVSSLLRKLDAADRRDLAARAASVAARPTVAAGDFLGLPSTWTSFVGRSAELDETAAALASNRLVTLVGPGGIGKTRVSILAAQRAASAFPAGGAFVNLVPVSEEFVVQAVAAALGVVERAQESLVDVVHERLGQGPSLLVLDNCEHVLAAAARFVEGLLAACPAVVVLATSREGLGVSGERVVRVPPLATAPEAGREVGSDAVRLFLDRAADATGTDADPALVAEICRRLDGMPLAIELAAARSGSLGVEGLIAGLDDHLRLLSRGSSREDRHGSLRAVIDWSHQLLDDDERVVFRRLGIFAGAFDLASATTVAADGDVGRASDVVGRLADKSLLVDVRSGAGRRWRMLETVHAYAHEQLAASGEDDDLRLRHLAWATAEADRIEGDLDRDPDWAEHFDAVIDDLRGALHSVSPGAGGDGLDFTLAMSLGHLAYARRFLEEARGHFAFAAARAPDDRRAVDALRRGADAAFAEMRGEAAFALLLAAHERALAGGDRAMAAVTLADASAIAGRDPGTFSVPLDPGQLVELTARARALAPDDDDLEVSTHLALAAAWDGARGLTVPDPAAADLALVLARRFGDPVLISGALDAVASSVHFDGHLKQSAHLTAERLELLDRFPRHEPRVGGEVADIFHMACETSIAAGELPAALDAAQRSYDDTLRGGLAHLPATHLVPPLVLRGSFDEALVHAEVMRDGWERAGRPAAAWMAPSSFLVALVHGVRGDDALFAEWWERAEQVCSQTRFNTSSFFVGPRVALHQGRLDRADMPIEGDGSELAGSYLTYARAISVEVAVVAGKPDAAERLEALQPVAAENDFVAALLARAAGRLRQDPAELARAVTLWEAIGARFERACTLVLLPDRAAEGRAELDALGCTLPVL